MRHLRHSTSLWGGSDDVGYLVVSRNKSISCEIAYQDDDAGDAKIWELSVGGERNVTVEHFRVVL